MNAGKSLVICMVTAGVLSILYIYAMANFATCIAYTVIFIIELWLVAIVLIGVATMGGGEVGKAAATAVADSMVNDNPALNCAISG